MPIDVGIIGCGIMARRTSALMADHGGFHIRRGFDPDPAAVADAGLQPAESADALVAAPDVDMVYIACPPRHHAEHARRALAAGKPVLCEKPLGVDVDDSRQLVDEFDAAGIANAVNFSFAGSPGRAWLAERLATGEAGTIDAVDIRIHYTRWPEDWQEAATWVSGRAQGGFVREVLSHFIYLLTDIMGPATVTWSKLRHATGTAPDLAETHAWAELDCGGVPVSFAGGTGGSGPDIGTVTVWGEDASYRLKNWHTPWQSVGGAPWTRALPEIDDMRTEARRRQIAATADWYHGRPHPLPDFRHALAVQEIIECILQRKERP